MQSPPPRSPNSVFCPPLLATLVHALVQTYGPMSLSGATVHWCVCHRACMLCMLLKHGRTETCIYSWWHVCKCFHRFSHQAYWKPKCDFSVSSLPYYVRLLCNLVLVGLLRFLLNVHELCFVGERNVNGTFLFGKCLRRNCLAWRSSNKILSLPLKNDDHGNVAEAFTSAVPTNGFRFGSHFGDFFVLVVVVARFNSWD